MVQNAGVNSSTFCMRRKGLTKKILIVMYVKKYKSTNQKLNVQDLTTQHIYEQWIIFDLSSLTNAKNSNVQRSKENGITHLYIGGIYIYRVSRNVVAFFWFVLFSASKAPRVKMLDIFVQPIQF